MKRCIRIMLTSLLLISAGASEEKAKMNEKHRTEMLRVLEAFAKERGLSRDAVDQLIFSSFINRAYLPKAGLGVVRDGCYVDLRSAENIIRLRDGDESTSEIDAGQGPGLELLRDRHWVGMRATETEIVFIVQGAKGFEVTKELGETGLENSVMVVFQRSVIFVLDLANSSSGYYKRQHGEK